MAGISCYHYVTLMQANCRDAGALLISETSSRSSSERKDPVVQEKGFCSFGKSVRILNLDHVEIGSCQSGQNNYLFMAFFLRCMFRQVSDSKVHIQVPRWA